MKLAVLCMAAAGLILLPLWVSAVGWLLTPTTLSNAIGSGTKLDKKLLREETNM